MQRYWEKIEDGSQEQILVDPYYQSLRGTRLTDKEVDRIVEVMEIEFDKEVRRQSIWALHGIIHSAGMDRLCPAARRAMVEEIEVVLFSPTVEHPLEAHYPNYQEGAAPLAYDWE